jgi:hypothetical protein
MREKCWPGIDEGETKEHGNFVVIFPAHDAGMRGGEGGEDEPKGSAFL